MPKTFTGLGFSLLYPDTWRIDSDAESASVSLESPEGAFLAIRKLDSLHEVEAAVEQAGQAMRDEYDDVEQESCVKQVAGFELQGITQRFVCLDLIVTSHLLVFDCDEAAYLIQMQAEDRDMERLEIVFEAMVTSLCTSLKDQEIS